MHPILNLLESGGSFKLLNMHPIDKKNKIYASVIFVIALAILIFSLVRNPYYAIGLGVLVFFVVTLPLDVIPKFILLSLWVIFSLPAIYLAEYLLIADGILLSDDAYQQFIESALLTIFVLIVPLFAFTIYFIQLVNTAYNEKEHYDVIEKHPYIICTEHHTRTKKYSSFTYKGVKCRIGKKCLARNKIKHAVKLVGLIGLLENGKSVDNSYYVTLWDHQYRKIRYGDYDVIEIHENAEVKNYDFIISKIILFFTNEIKRFKPMREVVIIIVGRPKISENTKRMLEKHFLKVVYLVPELQEVEV